VEGFDATFTELSNRLRESVRVAATPQEASSSAAPAGGSDTAPASTTAPAAEAPQSDRGAGALAAQPQTQQCPEPQSDGKAVRPDSQVGTDTVSAAAASAPRAATAEMEAQNDTSSSVAAPTPAGDASPAASAD